MDIIWSPLAVEQVQDIAAYIALDKPSIAIKWIEKIFNVVERLRDFPESGRVVPELNKKEIREIVEGSYRIIYKVKSEKIFILIVKSYRQLLNKNDLNN